MSGTLKPLEEWIDHDVERSFYAAEDMPTPTENAAGKHDILHIDPCLLRLLAARAFRDCAFYMAGEHLEQLAAAANDPEAGAGERYVAALLIRNAVLAAEGVLPLCQDTGTAAVFGFKGDAVYTGGNDARELSLGIRDAWQSLPLRYSQMAPVSMFEERNTGDNLPAQIDLQAVPGKNYRFLFVAKGGGSANKTCLLQESKAVLNDTALEQLLESTIRDIGVAACPPYHLAIVIGGFSAEYNLRVLKLATCGYLDSLPRGGEADGRPFRDPQWEKRIMHIARKCGLGAQFGGRHMAAAVRVIRLTRHAGSCPLSLGVSCSAHRNLRAAIRPDGVFIEKLERNPARFLDSIQMKPPLLTPLDLDRPLNEVRRKLASLPSGSLLALSGRVILARDIAHSRFIERLNRQGDLPDYLRRYPVYYAGPAKTPPGHVIGSLGPTTSQRMDTYVPQLMANGASLIMIGKGPRSEATVAACREYGGFYLAAVGGAAALMAGEHVTEAEVIDFPELEMEAVRLVRLRRMPAMLILP